MRRTWIVVLLASLLLLACQPTPEQEYVVNKGDGKMEEMVFATPPAATAEAVSADPAVDATEKAFAAPVFPAHWTEDLSSQYVDLRIDADIYLDGPDAFPVYSVSRSPLSDREKAALIHALLPDAESAHEGMERTREELEEAIANALRGVSKRGSNGKTEYVVWDGQEQYLTALQDAYREAVPEDECYREIREEDLFRENATYTIKRRNGEKGSVLSEKTYNTSAFTVSDAGIETYMQRESWEAEELWDEDVRISIHPSISEEQAIAAAEQFFLQIGEEVPSPVFSEPARIYSDLLLETVSEGYYLRYRQNGGYPVVYSPVYTSFGGFLQFDKQNAYACPWTMETIELYVDELGVRMIKWSNHVTIDACVNENVQILSFEELKPRITNLLRAGIQHASGQAATGYVMKEMRMTAYPIALKDQKGYVLAPVWYLSFDVYRLQYTSGNRTEMVLDDSEKMAVLINAIDGSCVILPEDGSEG